MKFVRSVPGLEKKCNETIICNLKEEADKTKNSWETDL
jgi:hypothetical protein